MEQVASEDHKFSVLGNVQAQVDQALLGGINQALDGWKKRF